MRSRSTGSALLFRLFWIGLDQAFKRQALGRAYVHFGGVGPGDQGRVQVLRQLQIAPCGVQLQSSRRILLLPAATSIFPFLSYDSTHNIFPGRSHLEKDYLVILLMVRNLKITLRTDYAPVMQLQICPLHRPLSPSPAVSAEQRRSARAGGSKRSACPGRRPLTPPWRLPSACPRPFPRS